MKKSRVESSRGSAMVITMCLLGGLLIVSLGYLILPWQEYRLTHIVNRKTVALSLAEAGVDYTCWAIGSTGNIADWTGTAPKTRTVTDFKTFANETKGDFTIRAWATPMVPKDYWLVESIGYAPGMSATGVVSRTVKALCVPAITRPFSGGLLGNDIVTLNGDITTDSYDSRIGNYGDPSKPCSNIHRGAPGDPCEGKGDIATNSTGDPAVNLGNNITVYGDLMTGEGGTVSGDVTITGTITHDFSQELPYKTAPTDVTYAVQPGDGVLTLTGGKDAEYAPGNYKFTQIKITSTSVLTINGPSIVWITGYKGRSIDEIGSATIRCVGPVTFYVDAEVSLNGNGLTNSSMLPTDCLIFASQSCTRFDLGGSNTFYGAVYAPNANVNIGGSADRYGAFVGKTVTIGGGNNYHYDEALGEVPLHGGKYTLRYWQEL